MSGLLDHFRGRSRVLVVVAAPAEFDAVCAQRPGLKPLKCDLRCSGDHAIEVVESGVGKVNAALAVAQRILASGEAYAGVLSLGIAGSLPDSGLELAGVVVAQRSAYADEGLLTMKGFTDCAAMGFPLGPFDGTGVPADIRLVSALSVLGQVGIIATVSTCSGTDLGAMMIRARTYAIAEAMEGAAVGHAALRFGLPFAEVRAISNTTGDRDRQVWALKSGLAAVGAIASRL